MTTVLALDTSTRVASVAVSDNSIVLAEVSRATHGADLLLLVDEACRAANIESAALDAIAVGAGPGSFTGLRIGLATAKGLAFAAGRPLWVVSSLAALAAGSGTLGVVVAVLDARRGQVFAGAFRCTARDVVALGEERVIDPGELVAFADAVRGGEPLHFVGDANATYPELGALPGQWSRTPHAIDIARLALAGPREDALVGAVPAYLRRADAEIMYPEGIPGALRKR
jgi:tRNA threonylcarbamoyladenosine biosynthesis protein TsaB